LQLAILSRDKKETTSKEGTYKKRKGTLRKVFTHLRDGETSGRETIFGEGAEENFLCAPPIYNFRESLPIADGFVQKQRVLLSAKVDL